MNIEHSKIANFPNKNTLGHLLTFNEKQIGEKLLADADQFTEIAKKAASSFNCRYLFEFPAILIEKTAEKAAAILCPNDDDAFEIIFLVFDGKNKQIDIVSASEAPTRLVDFAWSFTQVLAVLPGDRSSNLH